MQESSSQRFKYPRTPHLPFSPGATADDIMLLDSNHFAGKEVVASLKMDGECTTMARDYIHARSLDSRHHPSRDWVKNLHAKIAHDIPTGYRLVGEGLFARHSIPYHDLPSFFMLFAVYNEQNTCLGWDDTKEWAALLGFATVPELYRGIWDEQRVMACYTGTSPYGEQEGYVVRLAEEFPYAAHRLSVAKFVRANFVTTTRHWMSQQVVPNKLLIERCADSA